MKRGRYIEPAIVSGRIRAEVTAPSVDIHSPAAPGETIIEIKADCEMSEANWTKFVEETNQAIEREKRGGC